MSLGQDSGLANAGNSIMILYNKNIKAKTSSNIIEIAILIILFVFGIKINLFYGRMGFMPVDHSITFDGGWRIISGQVPLRDFTTPHSLIPIMLQALVFKILGVNWFAYCMHAAILNGLFCIVVYRFLKLLGGARTLACFYALLSGVIFYPPFGVPSMDQHGFFFVILSITLLNIAISSNNKIIPVVSGYLVFPTMFLAYLSKPSIALLGVLLLCGILLIKIKDVISRKIILRMITSLLLCLVLVILLVVLFRLDWHQIKLYTFDLPLLTSKVRLHNFMVNLKHSIKVTLMVARYPISAAQLFICLLIVLSIVIKKNMRKELLYNIFLAEALFLFCVLFSAITWNHVANSLPFLFIYLGITNLSLIKTLNNMKDHSPRKIFIYAASALLISLSLFGAYRFNLRINATRQVNDIFFKQDVLKHGKNLLPKNLDFILWQVPDFYKFSVNDFSNLIKFLEENPGNFYLLGDSSILYGLTNRPSVNPSLWFDFGLTIPPKQTEEFTIYQQRLMQNIRKYKARFIITEGDMTWTGCRLSDFDQLDNLTKQKGILIKSFGGFKVFKLISQEENR